MRRKRDLAVPHLSDGTYIPAARTIGIRCERDAARGCCLRIGSGREQVRTGMMTLSGQKSSQVRR